MPNVDTEDTELKQKDGEVEDDELSEEDLELAEEDEESDGDQPEGKSQDDPTDWKAKAQKAEAIARRLAKKLKKQREEKKLEQPKPEPTKPSKKESPDDVDEKILRATKGYDDDAIDELKFIAEREGVSLFAAEADKRFKRYLAEVEEDKKQADASVGAGKGSGRKKVEPSLNTPGLTAEQHRKLWEEQNQGR